MVSPTRKPNVYRVSFRHVESNHSKSEIVCYVRVLDTGFIQIYYSHHVNMVRAVPVGPFKQEAQIRLHLTPLLVAAIRANVAMELWEYFIGDQKVRTLPAVIGEDIDRIDWDAPSENDKDDDDDETEDEE